MCERFVAEGMRVVMADVEEARLVAEADRLRAAGGDVYGVLTDVSDPGEIERLAAHTTERYSAVHVVCNNAGVAPAGAMLSTAPRDWQWTVGVNVLGVAYSVVTFGPLLVAQGSGHIVNTASEAGLVTSSALGMYCATKHAVVGLSESLYRELEGTGVGVSVLCPSAVNTEIFLSERNRPFGSELTPHENAALAPLREATRSMGIAPAQVAGNVVEAIRTNTFWVFTHPSTLERAMVRFDDLRAARNPTPAYPSTFS
ncbi:MAG: SDR family NAD(P)-dependent oxidoreductase [Acidimicrobiales bacterium]